MEKEFIPFYHIFSCNNYNIPTDFTALVHPLSALFPQPIAIIYVFCSKIEIAISLTQ